MGEGELPHRRQAEVQETASSSSGGASSSPGGFSTAACTKAGDLESNLTSRTAKVLRAVCGEFDGVSSYGGYRPGSGSYHGSGQGHRHHGQR